MRVFLAGLLGLALLGADAARAECTGRDLLAALARDDPAAHDRLTKRASEIPNGEGIFWRVGRPGAAPSHLFGTLHSTAAAARGLPPGPARALDAARVLLVEIAPKEQARLAGLMADPAVLLDRDGPGLTDRLPDPLQDAAEAAFAKRGLPLAAVDRLKPWVLISLLAVPPCEQEALAAGGRLLDQAIVESAHRAGVPVAGLETAEQSLAAFSRLSAPEIDRLLADAVAGAEVEEDMRATLERLYREERLAVATELMIHLSQARGAIAGSRAAAAALEREVMVARNRLWLPRIRAALETGGAFVAVGALHLSGPQGLVALLRAEGFTLTRAALR